jgi:ABC-type nitrate/sulfonate/bicarbonate transport system substrate-binding protein
MKKLLFILFSLVFILSGCGSAEKNTNEELKKVKIMLDWFPNTNHTGIYAAKENGFYKEEGLDVEIVEPGEGVSADQIVASGEVDFAVSHQENITHARSTGVPIVSIGAIIQENTSAFASLKEENITSPKDFEGKRYGGWGSPTEEAVIKAVMDKSNADFEKVDYVTLGATDFFKSIGRDTDFQWIFQGWDGVEAARQGIELNYIYLKDLDPALNYYTPVIATSEAKIAKDKEMVQSFMKATSKGYQFAIEEPEAAADILIKNVPEINAELVKESQVWLSDQYQGKAKQWGIQDERVWNRYADWMYERKLIEENIEPSEAFTNEFLPEGKK